MKHNIYPVGPFVKGFSEKKPKNSARRCGIPLVQRLSMKEFMRRSASVSSREEVA